MRHFWDFMRSIHSIRGLTQSRYCWKDFVKLQQKKILYLTLSSIQVGCKMAGSTLGKSCFIWQMLAPHVSSCIHIIAYNMCIEWQVSLSSRASFHKWTFCIAFQDKSYPMFCVSGGCVHRTCTTRLGRENPQKAGLEIGGLSRSRFCFVFMLTSTITQKCAKPIQHM